MKPLFSRDGRRAMRTLPLPLLMATLFTSCATVSEPIAKPAAKPALRTVSHVDLPRFMGDWYVIANIPYFAEKGAVGSIESYQLRPDGRIANGFAFQKGSFEGPVKKLKALAWVHNTETNAEWRVRFFGLLTFKYLVLDLDPAYQWCVVGHPSRNYGWVLARSKRLPEPVYSGILRRLDAQGYDSARFEKVPQLPGQLPRKTGPAS